MYDGRYEDRDKADVYKFFDDSQVLNTLLNKDPGLFFEIQLGVDMLDAEKAVVFDEMNNWYRRYDEGYVNDNHFMIRMNAWLRLISFGEIHVHMILLNLVWMCAAVMFVRAFARLIPGKAWMLALFMLIPSMLFWQSGLLKEPLVFIGIGFFLFGLNSIRYKMFWSFLLMSVGLLILINLKLYIGLAGLMVLILATRYRRRRNIRFNTVKYTLGALMILAFGILLFQSNWGTDLLDKVAMKQNDFKNLADGGTYLKNDTAMIYIPYEDRASIIFEGDSARIKSGTAYTYERLPEKDSISVVSHGGIDVFLVTFDQAPSGSTVFIPDINENPIAVLPYAWFNTCIEPIPKPNSGWLVMLSGVEHMMVVLALLLMILYHGSGYSVDWNLILACMMFVMIVYTLIGATTPVLGAIVRYKTPLTPFVVLAGAALVSEHKLINGRYFGPIFSWLKRRVSGVPSKERPAQA